jgi:signal transduction histidine kinase/GAF domain-containing protein/ActR/RegA family two-component response regulator
MADTDPAAISPSGATEAESAASSAVPSSVAPPRFPSLLPHLEALMELQVSLSQEERVEEIVHIGTTAAVEILGADCGVALVDAGNGHPPVRHGSARGCRLKQHEVGILARHLDPFLKRIANGDTTRILLTSDPLAGVSDDEAPDQIPDALQARGMQSILILGLGKGAGRRGALVVGREIDRPFRREEVLLAEILAMQFAVQVERVRRTSDARQAGERTLKEVESATRGLRDRNQELEALTAVAAAASPSLEVDRQLDGVLRVAAEATGHPAGAVFLIETGDGDEALRCVRAIGEPPYVERAMAIRCREGEQLPGKVWTTGRPLALADARVDPDVPGLEGLAAAGYHAICCVPLRARGRIIGVLELVTPDDRFYREEEINLAEAVGGQVGVTIQNNRIFSDVMHYSLDLERRLQEATRGNDRLDRMVRCLLGLIGDRHRGGARRERLEDGMRRVLDFGGAEAGAVHLTGPRGAPATLVAQRGLEPAEAEGLGGAVAAGFSAAGGGGLSPTAAPGGETMRDRPLSQDGGEVDRLLTRRGFRHLRSLPLCSEAGVVGVISMVYRDAAPTDADEIACLQAAGVLLGATIDTADRVAEPRPAAPPPSGAAAGPAAAPPQPAGEREVPAQLVQAQKMESVGTLAGGIGHDFNNIVGAILGYATHIKSLVTVDNPIHRQASTIEQQARRAAELTHQLLVFARGGETARQVVDMNTVVSETISFLSKSLDRTIQLEVHTEPDLPPVLADPGQMRQALLNLAVNARDAMPQGGRITFETRVAHLDEGFTRSVPGLRPGDYIEVVVGDTGVGMPPDVADHAFEPFFSTKPTGQGTGLGLAVVYGIVRTHGGHATLSSTPSIGTTIRIYLPSSGRSVPPTPPPPVVTPPAPAWSRPVAKKPAAAVVDAARVITPPASAPPIRPPAGAPPVHPPAGKPPAPPTASASPPQAALPPAKERTILPPAIAVEGVSMPAPGAARARVLVVDDEEAIRQLAHDVLEARGYEVILAKDGVEALDLYRSHWGQIGLVILDLIMPRLGGLETFRRLLGMDRAVQVLLCSGYSHNEQAQQAMREGAIGLLSKPFGTAELLAWTEKVLPPGDESSPRPPSD